MRHTATKLAALTIVSAALALTLAGCAGSPAPAQPLAVTEQPSAPVVPEPTPESTPAPSADPLADAVALVIRPEVAELNDPSGATLLAVSYEAPAAEMVEALTAAIGSEPEVRAHDGGLETPPGVYYEWPGLTVSDPEPTEGTFTSLSNLLLYVSAAAVGGLESITTAQGYSVGTETAPILAEKGWTVHEFGAFYFPAEFGTELGVPSGDNPEFPNAWAVSISADPSATAITSIAAPINFGIQGN